MFKILKKSKKSKARLGLVKIGRHSLTTPAFLPDATRAVIKLLTSQDLARLKLEALMVNTYHLWLRPGEKLIKQAGGINKFMAWPELVMTDSGGYQVFSLVHQNPKMGKILAKKIIFFSPLDGKKYQLTPAKSMQIQFDLASQIMVCLDDCPPNDCQREKLKLAVKRTINWANICQKEYLKQIKKRKIPAGSRPLLIAVIQGGSSKKLRKDCAQELVKLDFDGYGFGARPVDSQGRFLEQILTYTADLIPEDKIRFGLGIGLPEDIAACVKMGWDLFDCVIPTREGRHGKLFLPLANLKERLARGKKFYQTINLDTIKYAKDFSAINPRSSLPELRQNSKAYLHHLFKAGDQAAARLACLNNLEFYLQLIKALRTAIINGKL